MTSYLLSFLRQKYASRTVDDFAHDLPRCWLVWEPGHWRPPKAASDTMLGLENLRESASGGEALAMALPAPKPGKGHVALGRDEENEITVQDATVSRVHCLLSQDARGAWTLRDGGSSNGTWVNGVRIAGDQSAALQSGASIRAGAVQLTFYDAPGLFRRVQGNG